MKRKTLIAIPMTVLATLAVAGTVDAHNATPTPSCGGLSWSAVNYDKTVTNSIVVKVDGATVHQDLDFKSSDDGTSPWSQTAPHTWSVVINAPDTQYDRSFSGVWQACQTAPTTTTPVTTVPATTTIPQVTTTIPVTTVVTDPTTTTSVVAVDKPPVPTTTLAPAGRGDPVCEPDMPCWPCREYPGYVCPAPVADVVSLTPAEPVLPITGLDGTIILVAALLVIGGVFLVLRGRRVG